jgi:hypothetical protein
VTYAPPPKPIPARGSFVATRTVGSISTSRVAGAKGEDLAIPAGTRVPAGHRLVRADPAAFAPVVPAGLNLNDALQCVYSCDTDGELTPVGVFVHRDDQVVRVNPWAFRLPTRDDLDELG